MFIKEIEIKGERYLLFLEWEERGGTEIQMPYIKCCWSGKSISFVEADYICQCEIVKCFENMRVVTVRGE